MKLAEKQIHELDPWKVKAFIHRERDPEKHARTVLEIKKRGHNIQPGQVRRIPKDEHGHEFELTFGEGRVLACREAGTPFRAFIEDQSEVERVGSFLTENLNREPLPWHCKARLVQPELAAGKSPEEIAKTLSLTVGHVMKFKRVLDKTSPDLESDVAAMRMNDAELFTALPKKHQQIVMEVFRETKDAQIAELVKKARVVHESEGELSTTALKKSLQRVDDELRRVREKLKLTRLHHSLGPGNLVVLLQDKKFRAALKKEGVNFEKFERFMNR